MENIDTLLAAVAQTQGFEDAEAAAVITPADGAGLGENSLSSNVVPEGSQEAGLVPGPGPAVVGVGEKRKRGRYGQLLARPPAPKRVKPEEEEEDVCFICFDGGSLVLCDRKGCPKAYHPACIKRDEAFFQSTARWYCGWHICSVCRKASSNFCYTCSYSLCKGCLKGADYSGVRRNKGFCSTCMKTIMLLENNGQANNESIRVDFDDKTSWEYLFKVYWVIIKEKFSLTLDELTRAQKPLKDLATIGCKPPSSTEHSGSRKLHVDINLDKINNKCSENPSMDEKATDTPCIKDKTTHEPGIENSQVITSIDQDLKKNGNSKNTEEPDKTGTGSSCCSSSTEWATNDLLEFVAHMKNGDKSALSQFDVQMLLLDYAKRNNLRDPRRKSQIICDHRLRILFGKQRVGHIEMLKLLESHFFVKEDSKNSSFIPAGLVSSADKSEMSVEGDTYEPPTSINSRKRKTRKKSDEKAPAKNNLKEYAAVDVHNINLLYLKRSLMENLLQDRENFNNNVIGTIVRIRISSNDQKQDVHRLVQVVGTTKVDEPYKIGDRTTDVLLEVLNLDKKEVVSIVAISNHDFTEDECRRLRQSIRCGLVKQFTVGEVQNKAMSIQPVRVDDYLEAEISRLNHLRDRASENGRKKELRECVVKLQLLKSPGERSRRISEIPEIHSDPKMNPNYESEEDTRSADNVKKEYEKPSYSGIPKNGRKSISPNKKDKEGRTTRARKGLRDKPDATGSISSEKSNSRSDHPMRSPGFETSIETASVGNLPSSSAIETQKLWHYCDPNGKTQGPFSMMQLRKWSTTGLFPSNMRIWTNHEQNDSVLLTDAFKGKFNSALNSSNSGAREEEAATGEMGLMNKVTNVCIGDSIQTESALGSNHNNVSVSSESNSGLVREDESGSFPQCSDLLKENTNNSDVKDVQECVLPPSPNLEKKNEDLHHHRPPQSGAVTVENMIITSGPELHNRSNNEDHVGLDTEEILRTVDIDLSSNDMECGSVDKQNVNISLPDFPSPTPKTVEIYQSDAPMQNTEILELLSPTPKPNNEDQLETEIKQSEFINFPAGLSEVQLPEVANEWCGYSPTPAQPPLTIEDVLNSDPSDPNWQMTINGTFELDAPSEDSVSGLLAQVETMDMQGTSTSSPTSAMKFDQNWMDDDEDCFSSIEFSRKNEQLTSDPPAPCNPISVNNTFDFSTSSSVHSSLSSEGETVNNNNGPVYPVNAPSTSLDVVGTNVGPSLVGSDSVVDPAGWSSTMVQGNINLVTVQGNVNLVLGGQGMEGLSWGTSQVAGWSNPNLNPNLNPSAPWERQRMYGGDRFSSNTREWGNSYQGGRGPRGRGYQRQNPKQRVCRFYESGHCRKGAFCDYLHPS